ncbi:unnamed protein product [Prunus armeniaca]|uniref:Uncharacterized protein n=1 Tax=Prunus armeniaca TaxID=36596 RepID=A0A6J5VBH3_PRUAR|nr:unnamed protein product [Prunus armeniaca]
MERWRAPMLKLLRRSVSTSPESWPFRGGPSEDGKYTGINAECCPDGEDEFYIHSISSTSISTNCDWNPWYN